ncbi:hypothetical protein RintRC_5467 [Richelia intracellularis]|nr:hypothetical protein RintRC_5467 [Richelia intracellularis]
MATLLLFREPENRIVAKSEQHNYISSQYCREVAPTRGRESAELHVQPQRNSHAFQNLNKGEVVVFMQIEGDFVKVRLNNGTQGWVVWNQIKPCTISSNN